LDFAPDLPYRGVEELRFAPGFFTTSEPDWWSYAFAWWLEDAAPTDETALGDALTVYFRGLCEAVGGGTFTFDPDHFQAALKQASPSDGQPGPSLEGQIETYDAFQTGDPLTLRVRAHLFTCGDHHTVLIGASPAAETDSIWIDLSAVLETFECSQ
jgi:hypothetical protein